MPVDIDLPDDEQRASDYLALDESDADSGSWVDESVGARVDWLYGEWEVVSVSAASVTIEYVDDGRFPGPQPRKRFDRDKFAASLMRSGVER